MLWVLTIYCAVIVTSSLLGGALPQLVHLTHKRMQLITSLVGGLMLGIALFHLLPHGMAELQDLDRGTWWMVMGIITMFFLLRMFHFHDHGVAEVDHQGYELQHDCDHTKDSETPHSDHHHHGGEKCRKHAHELSWLGIFVGLSVHTLIDGLALGASVQASAAHGDTTIGLYGLGTFLAIVMHKPLDAVSITSLMKASGWSVKHRNLVNLGYSLVCPLGALIFVFGVGQFIEDQKVVLGCALCFSAGVFLSIALADLLPELEFHAHDRGALSAMLLIGILLAYGLIYLEPSHKSGKFSQEPQPNTVEKPETEENWRYLKLRK